jgi:hypothetical protein
MELWLQDLVESPAAAQAMSARLPSYFTCALHDELRVNRDKYQSLTTHFVRFVESESRYSVRT